MIFTVTIVLFLIMLSWLTVLTLYLRRLIKNYQTFTNGINRKALDSVLSHVVKEMQESKKDIAKLVLRCDTIEEKGLQYIQKVGLLRFNPFKDTGGDQSFILSLVDANNTGVIITALYSRSGTRWYAKQVVEGKGLEHELSAEEKKALLLAHPVNKSQLSVHN